MTDLMQFDMLKAGTLVGSKKRYISRRVYLANALFRASIPLSDVLI